MADNAQKDSKIPILTQVYQPKSAVDNAAIAAAQTNQTTVKPAVQLRQNDPTLGITPELISRVTSHVRPRLEAEITQSVLENVRDTIKKDIIAELRAEINRTQVSIEANTADFIDRTKADLKTELPRMYQASADLAHVNLSDKIASMQTDAVTKFDVLLTDIMQTSAQAASENVKSNAQALQAETSAQMALSMHAQMQHFQTELLNTHQAQLSEQLTAMLSVASQQAKDDMLHQMQMIQAEALAQMNATFNEAMPSIYAAAADDIKTKFADEMTVQSQQVREAFLTTINADLPVVQEVLQENIQQVLAIALPTLENDLRKQLTTELHDMLLKVKFVLPR